MNNVVSTVTLLAQYVRHRFIIIVYNFVDKMNN